MKVTVTYEGQNYTGVVEDTNGYWPALRLENGELLKGNYKQGQRGTKIFTWAVRLIKKGDKWAILSSFNNSSRQVKDPNAYFLGIVK